MKDYFTYNEGTDITNGAFRISASQISRFFDSTSQWYREFMLGESGFEGSTASELGTCVHAAAAMYIDDKTVYYDQIDNYIDSITNPLVEKSLIQEQYPLMVDALVAYLEDHTFSESESFLWKELQPGIGVGGSCDARRGDIVVDFKTTSSKTPPKTFQRSYWFQCMVYAWLYKQQGIDIKFIQLVYITRSETGRVSEKTGKPLKDYPSQTSIVTEPVTEESLALIESCIHLITESVEAWNAHPELHHILAQDMRLKAKPAPLIFK